MPEVVIDRLGASGDGVAPGPIFVPRALPGEVVSGDIVDGRMRQPKIAVPSVHRVSAPCRHYRACGGCALQHAHDDLIADFKTDVVRRALAAHRLEAEVALIHTSPVASRRRATISGRRTKQGALVGFHAPQSDVLTPIEDCLVVTAFIRELLPTLDLLTREYGTRRAELKFAVTETSSGMDVDISGMDAPEGRELLRAIEIGSSAGLARLCWNGGVVAQYAKPTVTVGGASVPLPPSGFLQATRYAEEALITQVLAGIEGMDGPVIDLFSGVGTFTFPAARNRPVHAVEGSAAALRCLDAGWRAEPGLQKVTTEVRDLFRRPVLPDELKKFSVAIIDPPRAGAADQIEAIATSKLSRLVHISCNPATFARDAARLVRAGFDLGRIAVVDQFRWSPHVELVATFAR